MVAILLAMTAGISAAVADDGDVAGEVARVQGRVVAVHDAQLRLLMAGDSVLVGDVLSTGKDARIEITELRFGTHVDDLDIAPKPPKPWPTPMNAEAKRLVAFD